MSNSQPVIYKYSSLLSRELYDKLKTQPPEHLIVTAAVHKLVDSMKYEDLIKFFNVYISDPKSNRALGLFCKHPDDLTPVQKLEYEELNELRNTDSLKVTTTIQI